MLTGRKHTKIVRPGDGCLNWETPDKSGRLGKYGNISHKFVEKAVLCCFRKVLNEILVIIFIEKLIPPNFLSTSISDQATFIFKSVLKFVSASSL